MSSQVFTIIGAGKFGTAVGHVICSQIRKLNLDWTLGFYDISPSQKPSFAPSFSNIEDAFFTNLKPTRNWIIPAIGASEVESSLSSIDHLELADPAILLVSKGVSKDGKLLSQTIQEKHGSKYKLAMLAGPHFAADLMENHFTLSTAACNEHLTPTLQIALSALNPIFSNDITGLQISCVMKNMAAFCCGLAEGLGESESTRASVFSLCLEDAKKLIQHLGGSVDTLLTPAIIADWVMCCNSSTSRNFACGQTIARSENQSKALVESIRSVVALRQDLGAFKLPTLELIQSCIESGRPKENFQEFLSSFC